MLNINKSKLSKNYAKHRNRPAKNYFTRFRWHPRLEVGHKPGRLLVAGAAEGEAAEGENVRRCAPLPHQVQGGDAAFWLLAPGLAIKTHPKNPPKKPT